MYPTSVTVSDGSVNHIYDITSIGDGSSVRSDTTATLDQPALVTVKHQNLGKDLALRKRSLLRFDTTVEDAEGNQGVITAYTVVDVPSKIATQAQVLKVLAQQTNWLAVAGYKEKLLNGEI